MHTCRLGICGDILDTEYWCAHIETPGSDLRKAKFVRKYTPTLICSAHWMGCAIHTTHGKGITARFTWNN